MSLRALFASPLGFLIGISLGALGGGGSILAVPVLVFVAGQSPAAATTTSLAVVGIAALIGAHGHWRNGRVRVRAGVVFGLVGAGGSVAGSVVNRRLDGDVLLLAFAGLILVAAWRIVAGCPSCTRIGEAAALADRARARPDGGGVAVMTRLGSRRVLRIGAAGTAVGFLTGLFGVGGGFLIVPALALVLDFSMPEAVGTSLLVIAVNASMALAARWATGTIEWGTTLLFAGAAVAGVGVGRRIADRLDARSMQHGFAGLLVAVAVFTGGQAMLRLA